MARLRHVEVWSSWAFKAGASRLALILTARGGRTTRRVGGERSKTVQVAIGDATAAVGSEPKAMADAFAELRPNRVLRFVLDDDSWAEWLVLDVDDASSGDGMATVTCAGFSAALQQAPAVRLVDADGRATFRFDAPGLTLAQHWTNYLTPRLAEVGLGFVALGTDQTAGAKDVAYDADDPWAAAQQLASVFGVELDLTRDDGTSTYRVHFVTRVGAGLVGPRLASAENATIQRKRSVVPQRTRLDGVGAEGCSIGDAAWVVASKATNVLGLADPAGGAGPLLRDDQLNGLYLEATDRSTRVQITDSVAGTTQTVTVTSGAAFTVGDRVRVRADSAGTRLVALSDPGEVAVHGVIAGILRRDDIPETVNLSPNSDMALWSGAASAPPDGWAAVLTPVLTRTTDPAHLQSGGKSCRVQTDADGEGLAGPLVTVAPTALHPFTSGFLNYKLVSGKIRVEMVITNGVSTWIMPDGIVQKATPESGRLGVFDLLGVSGIDLKALGATAFRMRIVQDGPGTAEFYVDAVQTTESAGQLPLVHGAGPTQLWQAVNDELALVAPTSVRLEVRPADLYRLDAAAHPFHQFLLGATHEVVVPGMGLVEGVRVLEIAEEDDIEVQTGLTLSSLPEDLRSLQARRLAPRQVLASSAPILAGVRTIIDGQAVSGPSRLISASAGFSAADVGKTVWIYGAGALGSILKTTIASVTTTTTVVLSGNVAFQGTGMTAVIGPADQVATIGAQIGGDRAGGLLENDSGKVRPSAKDWQNRGIDRFFAKPSSADPDTFDSVPGGTTFIPQIPLLTIKITQTASNATTVTVLVTASDPTGGAAPTISHDGGGSVTDNGGGSYTIARAASGGGPRTVTFSATKTGRETANDSITAPEQQPAGGGTIPPSITHFYLTTTSASLDTATLAFGVDNPPAGYTLDVQWARLRGADGGNEGTVSGISTTSPWTFDIGSLDGNVDVVPKGTGGAEQVTYGMVMLMKSGTTVVATLTTTFSIYGIVTP